MPPLFILFQNGAASLTHTFILVILHLVFTYCLQQLSPEVMFPVFHNTEWLYEALKTLLTHHHFLLALIGAEVIWPVSFMSTFLVVNKIFTNRDGSCAPLKNTTSLREGNHLRKIKYL